MDELIAIHKNKKNIIKYIRCDDDYNTCFWYNLTCITIPDSKGVEIDRHSRIAEGKRLLFNFYNVSKDEQHDFLKKYPGFNWNDSLKVAQKFNININCYEFDEQRSCPPTGDKNVEVPYKLFANFRNENQPARDYNILLLNDNDGNQHLMYIISVEMLLGIKICPICKNHAIFSKDINHHVKRKMDTHMIECKQNNGKIVKHVTLEKFPNPFVPRITSNKTYRFLLSHNREAEYKSTQYYITFRFQTELQKIPGRNCPILIPTAVASTIKSKNYIKTISYDQSQEYIVEKWLDQVFIEAKQVRNDNKFADDVPQRYDVPVIGFDCMQSAATHIFMNLKSNKFEIIDRPGPRGCPIHIIVKSTENSVHLKFIDAKNYVGANMEFDDFLRDIGKIDSPAGDLIRQSQLLLSAIDNRIYDYIDYHIDLLQNTSLAKLSCLKKYAYCYKNFNISESYNPEDKANPFVLSLDYWKFKVNSYNEQVKRKKRRIDHNITYDDYEYFHEVFFTQRCHMCYARFTYDNKPSLDRIDNEKSHTKTNVIPCCLYCNKYASNKDKETARLMIQLRKFCELHNLPMTITDQEVYDSLCNDMVGVNSFVIHRENIAGKTQIHKFVKRDSNIISYGLPHIIDKIICLDFNSFYGSCMNSEQHPLIPYTNHRMYMPGGVKYIIHDYEQAKQFIFNKFRFSSDENIINKHVHLFIAKIKAHIPDEYINEFINFPVIWRNLKIITDKETIREFIYENMIRNNMQHIVEESKLMMLLLTHDQYMQFYNYYLWFLIDRCHLVIDDIKQVIVFAKHCAFNEFVKTNINQRCKAHIEGNKGEELKNKLEANTTFGYDSINTEKYQDFRLCNKKNVWKHHMSNTFLTDKQISENCFIVELEKKRCQCSTPLQVAYFTMDNSKYFYLNAFYNFLTPCLDMNYIHVIYGNIDSLCLAIAHESWPVKDKQLWDKFYPHLFPASNDYNDKKKILGWNIESEATTCLALVPKCYYMENQRDITSGNSNNMNQNAIMKLNGVKQEQNSQINKKQFQDNIDKNIITKVNNTSLIHKQEILSQVIQERIGISGINTKTIVLRNQACAPYVNGVKADKYFIDESH